MTVKEMDDVIQQYCQDTTCSECVVKCQCDSCNNFFDTNPKECEEAYHIVKGLVKTSAVNHPSHYNKGTIEVWDFISDWGLNFDRGNAIKYLCRAGEKDPTKEIQDLEKAIAYINHEISVLTGEIEHGKRED